jgi:flagellar assembly protein FliH
LEDTAKTANTDAAPRRFLFEHSFDVDHEAARKRKAEEEKPPEPTFSKEELEAAREAGYADGHSAGLQEASTSLEARTAQLVAEIGERLPPLSDEQAQANDRLMCNGARVATTIARKILPSYTAKHGTDELATLVTQCLETLINEPRIHVRVASEQVEPITRHLETAVSASGFDGRFLVEADDTMGPSDCKLTWLSGGLERNEADIWRNIDAAIAEYLGDTPAGAADTSQATDASPAAETAVSDESMPDDAADNTTKRDDTEAEAMEEPADMPEPLEDR